MRTFGSIEVSLGRQQLRCQDSAAGCPPQSVVGKADKLHVVDMVGADTPHRNSHATLQISIQTGLGTVILLKHMEELLGGTGQSQLLRFALEAAHQLFGGFHIHFLLEVNKDRGKWMWKPPKS